MHFFELMILTKYDNMCDKIKPSVEAFSHFDLFRNRAKMAFQLSLNNHQ